VQPVEKIWVELYRELTEAPGAPGFEGEVRAILRRHLTAYADDVVTDHLGSLFGVRRGPEGGPTVMVAGHMDEVAFLVTRVTEQGFVKFQPLGGWWSQVLLAQRVEILTEKGRVPGVIGSVPPHLLSAERRKRPVEIKEMFIDIGAVSAAEAEALGVRPGQPIVPVCPFTELAGGKRLMAKAWDNRFGCGLAVELLKEVAGEALPHTLYAGATVQEEVGLRGAATAAHLIQPDVFLALECSPAGDIPGVDDGFGKLGGGVLIRLYDRTMIAHPALRDVLLDIAEAENIPYQFFISQGGTDGGRVHLSGTGVPSAVIGVCARYIHSHAAIVDTDDLVAAKRLLLAVIRRLDRDTVEAIRRYA